MSKMDQVLYNDTTYKIIEKAKNISIISPGSDATNSSEKYHPRLPPWLDADAIRKGRHFVSKNFFLIFCTHFISLILLLSYVPVRLVLIKTGKSHTRELALRRYLSTLRHVKLWYESDLSQEASAGVRDVVKVRKIHEGVAKRIKESPNHCNVSNDQNTSFCRSNACNGILKIFDNFNKNINNNNVTIYNYSQSEMTHDSLSSYSPITPPAITQLDMIVTQYCFMGLLTTFPKKFGVVSKQDLEGLQGFVHIWAVVGHLLGIEDQFNLCIDGGDSERIATLKQFILKEILLQDLFSVTEETYQLWESLVNAMSEFVPCLSINAALMYILDQTLQLECSGALYNDSSLYEKLSYQLMITLFTLAFKVPIIRNVFNNLLRLAIYLTTIRLTISKMLIGGK